MPWRPSPPKIQGCRIDQQIQRWLKDQLQDSIVWAAVTTKNTRWCKDQLQDSIANNCTIRRYAEPFPAALHHMCVRSAI